MRTKSGRRRAVRRGGGGPAGGAEPQKAGLISHRRPWSQRHPQPRPQSHPLSPSTSAFLSLISSFPFPSPLSSRQNTAIRAVSRALKSSFPTRVQNPAKRTNRKVFFPKMCRAVYDTDSNTKQKIKYQIKYQNERQETPGRAAPYAKHPVCAQSAPAPGFIPSRLGNKSAAYA